MKRVGKALIIAGSLLLAGIIILAINLAVIEKHENELQQDALSESKKMTGQTYQVDGDTVKKIKIEVLSEGIQIEPTTGTQIEFIYEDNPENSLYEITQNGDTVGIRRKNSIYTLNDSGFLCPDIEELLLGTDSVLVSTITVRIPECYLGDYEMYTTGGNITMRDVPADGTLLLHTTSGDVELDTIECRKDIYIESTYGDMALADVSAADGICMNSSSGDVNLTDVTSVGDVSIDTDSGDMELNRMEITGNLDILSVSGELSVEKIAVSGRMEFDATTGSFTGRELTIGDLITDTNSGDISIEQLALINGIYGDSISGCFSVSLTDSMSDYNIITDTVSGDVTLPPESHTVNDRYIEISTVSGDIEFKFAE